MENNSPITCYCITTHSSCNCLAIQGIADVANQQSFHKNCSILPCIKGKRTLDSKLSFCSPSPSRVMQKFNKLLQNSFGGSIMLNLHRIKNFLQAKSISVNLVPRYPTFSQYKLGVTPTQSDFSRIPCQEQHFLRVASQEWHVNRDISRMAYQECHIQKQARTA